MKYMCLVYFEGQQLDAMTPSELRSFQEESVSYDEDLLKGGYLILAEALESVRSATTVRVRNGKLSATDGPFLETKEQLGGFVLIEARDLNDAIQVASRIPLARIGSVEVRPLMQHVRELKAT
jgi:hypothetical protein